jgi:hypothetical protein
MASRRRLGRGLSDIDQRVSEAPRTTGGIIPTQIPSGSRVASILPTYPIIPGAGAVVPEEGTATEVYPVELAEEYGQGPDRSTRVAAHKFVPFTTGGDGRLMRRTQGNLGSIYVRFQRPWNGIDIYVYKNVPESVYDRFSGSSSKGKFINDVLNTYPYAPAQTDPNGTDL